MSYLSRTVVKNDFGELHVQKKICKCFIKLHKTNTPKHGKPLTVCQITKGYANELEIYLIANDL